jgi:hypothetical protein
MFKKMLIIMLSIGLVAGISSNVFADQSANANAEVNSQQVQVDESAQSASITTTDNSRNTVNNRQFVNPGVTPIPGTNGFFTAPTPDSSFRQVKELIYYLTGDPNAVSVNLTEGACENLAKGADVDINLQVVRERFAIAKADKEGVRWITISMIAPVVKDGKVVDLRKEDFNVAGFTSAEADDGNTDSFQVIGKVALKAIKANLNHLQITAEGAHRKVESSGWGIGLYTTGAKVSDGGTVSGLAGGGTGYASNEAGPEDRPWIQGNVGLSK